MDNLKNIPLDELPLEFLTPTVPTRPLMKNSISSIDTASAALENHQTHSNHKLQTNQKLIVIGGAEKCTGDVPYKHVQTVNCYDFQTAVWRTLPELPTYRSHFAATITDQQDIIICGGIIRKNPEIITNSIDKFDWATQTWSKLAEMQFPGANDSIAICKGDLYVWEARGHDLNSLDSPPKILCYSFETKQWKYIKSPNVERHPGLLIEHKDQLYVLAGASEAIKKYDPICDEWIFMAAMKRYLLQGATAHQDKICLHFYDSLEEYDPEANTWSSLPVPPFHSFTSLVSFNGKLLSVGGSNNQTGEISDSIYEFDYFTRKWIQFTNMNTALMFASTFVGPFY